MSEAALGRRMFELTEPIALVAYQSPEPAEAVMAGRFTNYWDAYFAGRAAPLGGAPAGVVHALFYNFADGEVARHIPRVWDVISPDEAIASRQRGCAAAIRRIAGDLLDSPAIERGTELLLRAAATAKEEGRPMYAALKRLPIPEEPVERLWHAANLMREHRGDGHVAALVSQGIGGTECHVLHALYEGIPAEKFGRVHHLPAAQLADVIDGMRERGLIDSNGWLSDAGRKTKERVESLTDELAAQAYAVLTDDELEQLTADLGPVAATLKAVGSE